MVHRGQAWSTNEQLKHHLLMQNILTKYAVVGPGTLYKVIPDDVKLYKVMPDDVMQLQLANTLCALSVSLQIFQTVANIVTLQNRPYF